MSVIREVLLSRIEENPFRNLGAYPTDEKKVDTLAKSMAINGFWEGIIVRPHPTKKTYVQSAYGHHRIEAAKKIGLKKIPVIVRSLTDSEMLLFMAHENSEDFRTQFLVQYTTWDAAVQYFLSRQKTFQALDIATFLGWVRPQKTKGKIYQVLTETARACNAAHALIKAGHLKLDDLIDLDISAARLIVERTYLRIEQMEKLTAQHEGREEFVKAAQKDIAKAAKITAREHREGRITARQAPQAIDHHTWSVSQRGADRPSPAFLTFGKSLLRTTGKLLEEDSLADRIRETISVASKLTDERDKSVVRELILDLEKVSERALSLKRQLEKEARRQPKKSSVSIRALPGGKK